MELPRQQCGSLRGIESQINVAFNGMTTFSTFSKVGLLNFDAGRQLNVVLERFIVVQSGAGKTARCGPNLAPCHDAKVHCDAIDGG